MKYAAEELAVISEDTYQRTERILRHATPEEWAAGTNWYHDAHRTATRIAHRMNAHPTVAAAVIAALSPRVRWDANVEDAHLVADGEVSGFRALGTNVVKAWRIIAGEDAEDVLGGRKVRSFWRNIAHPTTSDDVTLDVWMLRSIVDPKYLEEYAAPYNWLAVKGVYDAVSDGVRRSAHERGLMAHEVQATVWLHVRNGG